jgi:hypothetical protein
MTTKSAVGRSPARPSGSAPWASDLLVAGYQACVPVQIARLCTPSHEDVKS